MQLYGVEHGGFIHFGGLKLADQNVYPADQMLEQIADLPTSARVGVETTPEIFNDEGASEIHYREADIRYWRRVIEVCEDTGHEIAYLDSIKLNSKIARNMWDLHSLEQGIWGPDSKYTIASGKERDVEEVRFAIRANIEHMFAVEREDAIFRRLAEDKPELAVIGLAHADLLMLTPDLAAEVEVEDYFRVLCEDVADVTTNILVSEGRWPTHQFVDQSDPDPTFLKEREHIIRQHRAATLGRVVLGTEPQWIGSWRVNCRPEGLFEVYLGDTVRGQTTGIIEDGLGTAFCNGEFSDERIAFEKEYDPKRTLGHAVIEGSMGYEATRKSDDEFSGVWYSIDQPRFEGEFIIRQGDKLYEPMDLPFGEPTLF